MNINGITTFTNRLRITGLATGLDTDEIISSLMSVERVPLDKMIQKRQLAQWRQEDYRNIINLLRGMKDEFFDILKPSTYMLSQSTYKKFTSTSTDSSIVTATGNSEAIQGVHKVKVESLAVAASVKSSSSVTKGIEGTSKASFENASDKSFIIDLDGVRKTIEITSDIDSADKLQQAINNAFGSGKIKVKDEDGKLSFSVVEGSGCHKITLTRTENDALTDLGFGTEANLSNRLSKSESLETVASKMKVPFSFDENGELNFTINGQSFTFDKSTTLGNMMNKINNDAKAGVNIQYDEINDVFVITAKQTGAGNNIRISENGSTFFASTGFQDVKINLESLKKDFSSANKSFAVVIDGISKVITLEGDYSDYTDEQISDAIKQKIENAFEGVNVDIKISEGTLYVSANGKNIGIAKSASGNGELDELGLSETYIAGKDAVVYLNGEKLIRSNNSFTVSGVTFTLHKASDVEQTITISQDVDGIYDSIKKFVDKYNEIITKINAKISETYDRSYQPLTDAQKNEMSEEQIKKWEEKAKTGLLRNDRILQSIVYNMRQALYSKVEGVDITLSSIGITTGDYSERGILKIDEAKLKEAIKNNPEEVMNLFSKKSNIDTNIDLTSEQRAERYNNEGLAYRLFDMREDNIRTFRDKDGRKGLLLEKAGMQGDASEYKNTLYEEIQDYNDRIKELTNKLVQKEERYYQQYAALERAIAQMSAQTNWLLSQFNQGY